MFSKFWLFALVIGAIFRQVFLETCCCSEAECRQINRRNIPGDKGYLHSRSRGQISSQLMTCPPPPPCPVPICPKQKNPNLSSYSLTPSLARPCPPPPPCPKKVCPPPPPQKICPPSYSAPRPEKVCPPPPPCPTKVCPPPPPQKICPPSYSPPLSCPKKVCPPPPPCPTKVCPPPPPQKICPPSYSPPPPRPEKVCPRPPPCPKIVCPPPPPPRPEKVCPPPPPPCPTKVCPPPPPQRICPPSYSPPPPRPEKICPPPPPCPKKVCPSLPSYSPPPPCPQKICPPPPPCPKKVCPPPPPPRPEKVCPPPPPCPTKVCPSTCPKIVCPVPSPLSYSPTSSQPVITYQPDTARKGVGGYSSSAVSSRRAKKRRKGMTIHGSYNVGRRPIQQTGYHSIVKRSSLANLNTNEIKEDSVCNDDRLKTTMLANLNDDWITSKQQIQNAIKAEFNEAFNVICFTGTFAYVTYTDQYCRVTNYTVTCYAFRSMQ